MYAHHSGGLRLAGRAVGLAMALGLCLSGLPDMPTRWASTRPPPSPLHKAQLRLWKAIEAGREGQSSELWSWSFAEGKYRVEPFGQRRGDPTESNAAHLWSTVFLAVVPPGCEGVRQR